LPRRVDIPPGQQMGSHEIKLSPSKISSERFVKPSPGKIIGGKQFEFCKPTTMYGDV